jgi:hypothetical protein
MPRVRQKSGSLTRCLRVCRRDPHAYLGVGDSPWSDKDFALLIMPRVLNSLEYFSPDIQEDQEVLRVYINNRKAAGDS